MRVIHHTLSLTSQLKSQKCAPEKENMFSTVDLHNIHTFAWIVQQRQTETFLSAESTAILFP